MFIQTHFIPTCQALFNPFSWVNPCNNPTKYKVFSLPFCRWRNWGTDRLGNLLKGKWLRQDVYLGILALDPALLIAVLLKCSWWSEVTTAACKDWVAVSRFCLAWVRVTGISGGTTCEAKAKWYVWWTVSAPFSHSSTCPCNFWVSGSRGGSCCHPDFYLENCYTVSAGRRVVSLAWESK